MTFHYLQVTSDEEGFISATVYLVKVNTLSDIL